MKAVIAVNKKFLEGMKKEYDKARTEKKDEFTYDGHEFITSYAKYFLTFYAPQFGLKYNDL